MNNNPIDIVIPWVDGSDAEWISEKNKYYVGKHLDDDANSEARYEDWDNLYILFRGIEKFLPWFNRVFLIVSDQRQIPEFIRKDHPKLRIVTHDEYIPEEYLPTFNSNTIEMNYFRIKELSENFILFNDDMFPMSDIDEAYYFQNNMVCEEAVEMPIIPVDIGQITRYSLMVKANNMVFINRHFSKREVQKKNPDKWFFKGYGDLLQRTEGLAYWDNFVGFHDRHMPVALKKSTLKHIWDIEPEMMHIASLNKFRDYTDVSQYIIRYWQICEGDFIPRRTLGEPFWVTKQNYEEVAEKIWSTPDQMICLMEDDLTGVFEQVRDTINNAMLKVLPDKSSFEK